MTKFHPLVLEAFKHAGIDPATLQITSGHPTGPDGVGYFTKTLPTDQVVAEHESLTAMNRTAPAGFCPRSFGIAKDEKSGQAGMVSEYFELGGRKDQRALGKALAEMHRESPGINRFGFHVDTFCGATRQDNSWTEGWKEFFVQRRAGDLVRRLGDRSVTTLWEMMQEK
jgi:protein-ribulosamine 3-kinase